RPFPALYIGPRVLQAQRKHRPRNTYILHRQRVHRWFERVHLDSSAIGTALPDSSQLTMTATQDGEGWLAHWKAFVACGIMILSPFQYGVDFGIIGGLQAMVGFLKVSSLSPLPVPFRLAPDRR